MQKSRIDLIVAVRRQEFLMASTLAAAAAALVLVSIPALHGPLILDSSKLYGLENIVREYGDLAVLHTPSFGRVLGRVASMASFVLNVQITGEISVFQLKLTNLLIHIANGALVFLLTRLIVRTTPLAPGAAALAAGTALLWLLSPLNFNVSLYTIQRMAQLSALFTLAGLVLYTAGRLHERTGRQWLYIGLSALVCLPLAVFSKQNGVLLVVLAFLVEIYFLHPARPLLSGRQWTALAIGGMTTAAALLFYLYPGILNYGYRDFTLAERLLSQPRALLSYLQHIVLPLGADTGIFADDFAASRSLFSPVSTSPALVACIAMAGFCALCRRGRFAIPAFGLAFFLGGHLLESTVIPLELYFLHRNYLPDVGIYLAIAWLFTTASPNRHWMLLAVSIYSAYFLAIDYARSLTWSNRERIFATAVHNHPDSPRALTGYAQIAVDGERFELALAANSRAVELTGSLNTRVQRLYLLCRVGSNIPEVEYTALRDTSRFGVYNELSQALGNLLALYQNNGCPQLDIPPLVRSLDQLAGHYGGDPWLIAYYADTLLYASGREARTHRRLQERFNAGHLVSGLFRLKLLVAEGRMNQAAEYLDRIEARLPPEQLKRHARELNYFRERILGKDQEPVMEKRSP